MSESFYELHQRKNTEEVTRSYETRYVAEIKHEGLGTYRVFKDLDDFRLDNKVDAQFAKWDEQWSKIVSKNKLYADKEASLNSALEQTLEAQEEQKQIETLLTRSLDVKNAIDWERLKDKKKFNIPNPINDLEVALKKVTIPYPPIFKELPKQPDKRLYEPIFNTFDKLFKSSRQKKIDEADWNYQQALNRWDKEVKEINTSNESLKITYESKLKLLEEEKGNITKEYEELSKKWEKSKEDYLTAQKLFNEKIEQDKATYLGGSAEAVIQYCESVLNNSTYPDSFPKDFDIDYNAESKLLIIEYVLPSPDDFPTLTEVKYVATKKELKETHISKTQLATTYDISIYKITLRTLHELFEADKAGALEAIIFNGWVDAINKATGKKVNSCIVSIQAKKTEFLEIELRNVDPKICFKNLKGIGSSKLSGITAIQPIAQINKNDKRFIVGHDVADRINEGFNLAEMDWEEFEHLLREIFEKEFSVNGGEVKVTQASRDGGVDAVAFDPDPIRGGKIVIQAKRYTNTVGVSAVRDLYGTVMNEGATKGILVTTADYGPDAYEFAKNKPITLMNGANLLYLLEKHGHKARINLAEAKKTIADRQAQNNA